MYHVRSVITIKEDNMYLLVHEGATRKSKNRDKLAELLDLKVKLKLEKLIFLKFDKCSNSKFSCWMKLEFYEI